MEQQCVMANPVSRLIHVFLTGRRRGWPRCSKVQTGGEVQPLVISPDEDLALSRGVRPDFRALSFTP